MISGKGECVIAARCGRRLDIFDTRVLRERPQKLAVRDRRTGRRAARGNTLERIGDQLQRFGCLAPDMPCLTGCARMSSRTAALVRECPRRLLAARRCQVDTARLTSTVAHKHY
jgi:hypothetical protein